MGKKDKKEEKKLAKKAAKAAKKAKKGKGKAEEIAAKTAAEMAEELRVEREAVTDVEEQLVEDAVAVVEEKQAKPVEAPAAVAYEPSEGEKLKTVSIKMPESLVAAADAAAAAYGEEGITRSEFIRLAIEKLVNEQ